MPADIHPDDHSAGTLDTSAIATEANHSRTSAGGIVFKAALWVWIPAIFIFIWTGSPFALLLPGMAFYPWATISGDPGYSEFAMNAWVATVLILFAILGILAVTKRSTLLAKFFAWSFGISFVLGLLRAVIGLYTAISGIH